VAQLSNLRPDLRIEPLRGNLDTRLRKLADGHYDAIVLATAGLLRLGLAERIREHFAVEQMLPAAGQGALGIEVRSDDATLLEALAPLSHRPTWLAVHAERAVSRGLGGSCSMPLAAHATWQDETLNLAAALGHASAPTKRLLTARASAHVDSAAAAEALGAEVVAALHAAGASAYLA
jgi:hydroxymethylbilane synthase